MKVRRRGGRSGSRADHHTRRKRRRAPAERGERLQVAVERKKALEEHAAARRGFASEPRDAVEEPNVVDEEDAEWRSDEEAEGTTENRAAYSALLDAFGSGSVTQPPEGAGGSPGTKDDERQWQAGGFEPADQNRGEAAEAGVSSDEDELSSVPSSPEEQTELLQDSSGASQSRLQEVQQQEKQLLDFQMSDEIHEALSSHAPPLWSKPQSLNDGRVYQAAAACALTPTPPPLATPSPLIKQCGFPPRITRRYEKIHGEQTISVDAGLFAAAVTTYADVLWAAGDTRPSDTAPLAQLRDVYTAHVLAHVTRSRARVARNDARAKQALDSSEPLPEDVRDQGFTRAKVLVLLPMRNAAYHVVQQLCALLASDDDAFERADEPFAVEVTHKHRFRQSFYTVRWTLLRSYAVDGVATKGFTETFEYFGILTSRAQADNVEEEDGVKPRDHYHRFRGNIDDDFMLGIAVRKRAVQLYSEFYRSDIVVASPLALRRFVEQGAGAAAHEEQLREAAADFLSSIEVAVVDDLGTLSMQNWAHVQYVLQALNQMPKKPRDADFARVREPYLDARAKCYRQTILLAEYVSPLFLALQRSCCNHLGRYFIRSAPRPTGIAHAVDFTVRQRFQRIGTNAHGPDAAPQRRFSFFCSHVLPKLRASVGGRTLIFLSSYLDYVRVRNHCFQLRKASPSFRFASLCEYTTRPDISRARARFFQGRVDFLLLTERFHFFYRHSLRGARGAVFYSLPEHAEFYGEVVQMLAERVCDGGGVATVLTLFDDLDLWALDRVVGHSAARKMTSASESARVFSLG